MSEYLDGSESVRRAVAQGAVVMDCLSAALRYAEVGYPVFPCKGKVPLTAHGFKDATTDADQIERWWAEHPQANIGIPTHGMVVIDVDGAGNQWPGAELAADRDFAAAPMSLTPGGGSHRFFRAAGEPPWQCSAGKLAPNVDVRTTGGYVIVPPSVSEAGVPYRWVDGLELDDGPPECLPEPPLWLAQQLTGLSQPASGPSVPASTSGANTIPAGQRNATLFRLGGTMRRNGMSETEILAALQAVNVRCRPPLLRSEVDRIAWSVTRYAPDQIAVAVTENHWDQMYAEPLPSSSDKATADPGPTPERLLQVPGFINTVMAHTLATAPYPEQALAFCGALALQAVLSGRKVRDETGSRTNLYLLALANSGAGKDHPRKVNQQILCGVGMPGSIGDAFASGEGIEDRMALSPAMLFQTDEIDGMIDRIRGGRDARNENIMGTLLKFATSASSQYAMRVRAGKAESQLIDQPCLCLFGTAIPRQYYEALTPKMLSNGFLARMVIVEARQRGPGQRVIERDIPTAVLATAQWWADRALGHTNLSQWHPAPNIVPQDAAGLAALEDVRLRAESEYTAAETCGDQAAMAIWARGYEKTCRLALVYACSENHTAPIIGLAAAAWAGEFVDHQTRRMLFMASAHVSESDFDSRRKQVLAVLTRWREEHGDAPMPYHRISRRLPWTTREHEEARHALCGQRLIEVSTVKSGGRPGMMYRLV